LRFVVDLFVVHCSTSRHLCCLNTTHTYTPTKNRERNITTKPERKKREINETVLPLQTPHTHLPPPKRNNNNKKSVFKKRTDIKADTPQVRIKEKLGLWGGAGKDGFPPGK